MARDAALVFGCITLCLFRVAGAQAADAQSGSPASSSSADATQLATIIVTAQKKAQSINDVPMSVNAMTGPQMKDEGIDDLTDLTKVAPGFSTQKSTYGEDVFTIRGVGFYDFIMGAVPAVTTYVDQVPLPYAIMARGAMLDLERVEILKGPQGTLFGDNSTGGAINLIPAKPSQSFDAGADVSYGRFNDTLVDGFISGPLSSSVAARFALSHESSDGWQYSSTEPGLSMGKKDFTNSRLLLDWTPQDSLHFELNLSGWWDRGQMQAAQFEGFYPALPATPLSQFTYAALSSYPIAADNDRAAGWDQERDFSRHDNFYLSSLRVDWDISSRAILTSITAYSHLAADEPIDTDGTNFTDFYDSQMGLLSSLSQELRIAGNAGPFNYMVGGNFEKDVADQTNTSIQYATQSPLLGFYTGRFANITNQSPTTSSAFASLDYTPTAAVTLQSSARYSHEQLRFHGCLADAGAAPIGVRSGIAFAALSDILSGQSVTIPEGGCLTLNSETFLPGFVNGDTDEDNVSWRAGLKWKAGDDTLLYGNVTKGFKAGNYSQVPGVLSDEYEPVKQESVLAYEVGGRRSFLGRRAELTGAVFYYDYRDKQLLGSSAFPVFNLLPVLINIPKSRVYGSELGLTIRPLAGLSITGGATYVNSRVQVNPQSPYLPTDPLSGAPTSYVGERFPNTPMWSGDLDGEYDFVMGGGLDGFVGTTVTARSGTAAAFGDDPQFDLNSYALLDLRLGLRSDDGKWEVKLWGHNVTDKYYWVGVTHLIDTLDRIAGDPATFGVSASYRY